MNLHIRNLDLSFVAQTLILFLLSASLVFAHGAGSSIEVQQDGYLIDIGYPEKDIIAGTPTQLSFLLYKIVQDTNNEEVLFTDVWVRLQSDGEMVFASQLGRPEFGDTTMSFNFPHSGEYELFVRYKDMQETLVEKTVTLSVGNGAAISDAQTGDYTSRDLALVSVISTILTLLILIFAFYILRDRSVLEKFLKKRSRIESSLTPDDESKIPAVIVHAAARKSELVPKNKITQIMRTAVTSLVVAVVTFLITSVFLGTIDLPQWNTAQLSAPSSNAVQSAQVVSIVLTESGYEPNNITIEQGTTVSFSTTAGRPHWPASSLHPSHEEYSEFDPLQPVDADSSWSFTFEKTGEWGFHDHLRSYFSGKITVVPASD